MKKILAISLAVLLTGCASSVSKLAKIMRSDNESEKINATGVVDALDQVPSEHKVAAVTVASRLAKDLQVIEGLPTSAQRLDVTRLIANDEGEWRKVNDRQAKDAKNSLERRSIEERLIDLGVQKEQENHKNLFRRILFWGVSTFGLGGMIALCVFFPFLIPIFLKLIGMVISWLVGAVPSLIHFFGVVGKSTMENVVTGVESIKEQVHTAKASNPSMRYSADDVLAMFKKELGSSTDQKDKAIIKNL